MARKPDPTQADPTQADPTQPRPVSRDGRTLDRWGLPIGGPARQRALAEAGRTDPNEDPTGWADAPAADPTPAGDAGQQD